MECLKSKGNGSLLILFPGIILILKHHHQIYGRTEYGRVIVTGVEVYNETMKKNILISIFFIVLCIASIVTMVVEKRFYLPLAWGFGFYVIPNKYSLR